MKPDLQRITIAEICGWAKGSANVNPDHSKTDGFWFEGRFYIGTSHLPDYLNSLDAMHEAENHIPIELEGAYWKRLSFLTFGIRIYHFTASQRAEAFLKTFTVGLTKIMKKDNKSDTPLTDKELAKTGEEFIRFFLPDFTRELERKLHKAQKEAKEWKKLLGIMIQEDEDNFNNLEQICLRHGATEADIGAGYGYGALGVIGLSDWLDAKLKQLLWNEC